MHIHVLAGAGYVGEDALPVHADDADIGGVGLSYLQVLPLYVDKTGLFLFRQGGDVGTVLPVDRNASALGDKAYDLVSRYRVAASGHADHQVVSAFDDDARVFALMSLQLILLLEEFLLSFFFPLLLQLLFLVEIAEQQVGVSGQQSAALADLGEQLV